MKTIFISALHHSLFKCVMLATIVLCAGVAGHAQMKEGAVNVLINEDAGNQEIHTSFRVNGRDHVSFTHPVGKKIFSNYRITRFERTYPGIEKYNHPNAKILSRYYTIEGNFRRDRVMYDILKEGGELFEDVEQLEEPVSAFTPNDYNLQTFGDDHLEQIRATLAWNLTKGSRSVSVAVSDPNGFYFGHPDYVNSNSTNQIVYRDAAANDQTTIGGLTGAHGLVVASSVAAATHNNEGISGIGYNTSLMAFDGSVQDMLSAAYDHNAPIVVASWRNSCSYIHSHQLIMDMIHDHGTTIIVAAGNGNMGASGCPSADGKNNGLTYPASYNHVISVSSVTKNDEYTQSVGMPEKGHHTYNEAVDLTAPGWSVAVATASNTSYSYSSGTGTSISAPIVAGVAGLILSFKPDLPPDGVEYILESTAVNVDNIPGNEVYAGLAGAGRVDAYAAVARAFQCFACEDVYYLPEYDEYNNPVIPYNPWACKINFSNYTVSSFEVIEVTGTREVRLLPGFHAMPGSNVVLKIDGTCILSAGMGNGSQLRRKTNGNVEHVSYRDLILSGQIEIPETNSPEEPGTDGIASYPNPAQDNVVIRYTLESASHVNLELQDLSGNSLATLVNEYKEQGEHEVKYNVSGLAQGIYFYVLKSTTGRKLGRLVVIR